MQFEIFGSSHLEEARALAQKAYGAACHQFPALPQNVFLPSLAPLCNGLGIAAVEKGKLMGFLAAEDPIFRMFGTMENGVFSPVHAHGLSPDAPEGLMQRLYQHCGALWQKAGALWHAVCLYENETAAARGLIRYGFGQRCADAVRTMLPLDIPPIPGIEYKEVPPGTEDLEEMHIGLWKHLLQSPCFLSGPDEAMHWWLSSLKTRPIRVFAAYMQGKPVAYMEARSDGENFITHIPGMLNICGAYCDPAFRGTGISPALLSFVLDKLQKEGITHLGVDYETMNPTAAGFWEKHFTPYTQSLVKHLDTL